MVKTADVDITPFVASHGKPPRGKGSWAFRLVTHSMRRAEADQQPIVWAPNGLTFAQACKTLEDHEANGGGFWQALP
jgi:hypothetical protein